ncbi:MAG TPA: hypothetical protein VFV72_04375 [Candidatus Limnocylindrales bacterium]|nr:hypothetical protein [Candidatus Limnocylindrales bacterium]
MEPRDTLIPERIVGARDGRRSAATTMALIGVLLIVAVVKPWGDDGAGPGSIGRATPSPRPADGAPRTPAPPDAADRLAEVCLNPSGWRIIATERWDDDAIRSWRAVEASTASNPLDPDISFTRVAAEAVPVVGYCAPISGPDRPPEDARGSVFSVADGTSSRLRVTRLAPIDDVAGGAAWLGFGRGASGGAASPTWPLGRYAIRVGTSDGRYERWLGIEILRPFLERSAPTPTTLPR